MRKRFSTDGGRGIIFSLTGDVHMSESFENSLYQSVESALGVMNCDIGPSECHGILCGMLSGVQVFDPTAWLAHTTGYDEDVHFDELGRGHVLGELLEATVAGFSAEDFSLQILLPADDSTVSARIEALSCWCRGFLSGFGLAEIQNLDQLSDDSQGFLRDLQDIGRVDPIDTESDGDEFALMEICEYARIGALLLHEETRFASDTDLNSGSIH